MSTSLPQVAQQTRGQHLILYDGVCGLCNRLNTFLLRRDACGVFVLASLQSAAGQSLLGQFGRNPQDLNTFYVVVDRCSESPTLLSKSRAALFVLKTLGGPWRLAALFGIVPTPVLDMAYDLIARYRYRLFGRYEICPAPSSVYKTRFIDL